MLKLFHQRAEILLQISACDCLNFVITFFIAYINHCCSSLVINYVLSVLYTVDISLHMCPQCPADRVAVEEDNCNCVVGPPEQRGLPGHTVTRMHTH